MTLWERQWNFFHCLDFKVTTHIYKWGGQGRIPIKFWEIQAYIQYMFIMCQALSARSIMTNKADGILIPMESELMRDKYNKHISK